MADPVTPAPASTTPTLADTLASLSYKDLTAEFPEIAGSRYAKVIYLRFDGSIEVDVLIDRFMQVAESLTEPTVLIPDMFNYQDIYSITHNYDRALALEHMLKEGGHFQVVLINTMSKFILTVIDKTLRLTGVQMHPIDAGSREEALAKAKEYTHKLLAESPQIVAA